MKKAFVWTDALTKPKVCIHRYGISLVGSTHANRNGSDRRLLVATLSVGTKLLLVPDPDNPVDRNAVLVYRLDDPMNDLGYLEHHSAARLCKLMERGVRFEADVYWIDRSTPEFPKVYVFAYQMTQPTASRRPTRKDAPKYKPPVR